MRGAIQGLVPAVAVILGVGLCCGAEIAYQQFSFGFGGVTGGRSQARLLSGPDGTLYGTTYEGGRFGRGTIFKIQEDGSGFELLYDFKPTGGDGAWPYGDLVFGRDGFLYGTTEGGGTNNGAGTMFKIKTDGTGYQVLFHFFASGGYGPRGHLQEGTDGAFYGTTQFGGLGSAIGGTIYKINQDGTGFVVLHRLRSQADDGYNPDTGLTLGSDGMLYGVASSGGVGTTGGTGAGTLFKISQSGTGYTNLHQFRGPSQGDGYEPDGRPLELADGRLYGTTDGPGFSPPGTIYRINKDGSGYTVLRMFNITNGEPAGITSEAILGSDGALYSTTGQAIFKIRTDGSGLVVLRNLILETDGYIGRGLIIGKSGALFGTTSYGGGPNGAGTLFRINEDGSDFRVLFRFINSTNHLQTPRAPLIRGSDGLFYGTTESGGISNAGAIFSMGTNGRPIRMAFAFGEGTNMPRTPGPISEGSDGRLYGLAQAGGIVGGGGVFSVARNGSNYTILKRFDTTSGPIAGRGALIEGADGWLYGASSAGGLSNRGLLFKIHKDTGELVIIHYFGPTAAEGVTPQGGLVRAADGALYGMTSVGGESNFGTIFCLQPDGSGYTNLHSFKGGAGGQNPQGNLIIGSDQKLYGTTPRVVGAFAGTVFSIAMDGTGYQVLKAFANTGVEPKSPRPVVQGLDGMLYGVTFSGGTFNKGTLFRLNRDGTGFQILRHFGNADEDGQNPSAALTLVGNGTFLGVTEAGGESGLGSIFRFDPVETRLRIVRSGAQALLTWNRSSTIDVLQASDGLTGDNWQPFYGTRSQTPDEFRVEAPIGSTNRFFRIRRQWQ